MQAKPVANNNTHGRAGLVGGIVLPLMAMAGGFWSDPSLADSPRYTWFGAGYEWMDVQGAVKVPGGQHEGYTLDFSVGIIETGPIGIHLFGDYFDGDLTGQPGGDLDSTSWEIGLGASWSLTDSLDLVGRASWLEAELDNVDDDGYAVEGWLRGMVSEKVELEAGYRYEEIRDSDISNQDVMVGIGYSVLDQLQVRVRGVLFDDDTGFEVGVRWYFGDLLGRDYFIQ